jgi:hypothetical protein
MAESSELSSLIDSLTRVTAGIESLVDLQMKSKEAAERIAETTEATTQLKEAENNLTRATKDQEVAVNSTKNSLKTFGNELMNVSKAGVDFAKAVGTSATQGVQLELNNRSSILSQLGRVEADRIATIGEQRLAQRALTDTFISTSEGFRLSATGTTAFINNLKGGFKSDFELTGQSLRALTIAGLSTESQMDAFRQASGRASLSSDQLSKIVNNNSLSIMLYGKSFAKAAVDAERLGISLSQVQSAQQSMITNLDNVIDVTAQLNQLGGNVDFGTLVQKLEMEGPDAVLKYLSSAIPGDLMQSTSFRALVGQLGIPAETILKQQKLGSTADAIESRMTEAGKAAGTTAKSLTELSRVVQTLQGTYLPLITSTLSVIISFGQLAVSSKMLATAQATQRDAAATAKAAGVKNVNEAPVGPSLVQRATTGAKVGVGVGAITGIVSGISEYQQSGDAGRAFGRGLANLAGSIIGGALGSFIAPPVGTMIGATAGAWAANWLFDKFFTKADDLSSPGYGSRVLLGPEGRFALNNNDSVLAGTNLFGNNSQPTPVQPTTGLGGNLLTSMFGLPGALISTLFTNITKSQSGDSTNANVTKKIDELLTVLRSANTTIEIDGTSRKVPRMQLVGVYSRNEAV